MACNLMLTHEDNILNNNFERKAHSDEKTVPAGRSGRTRLILL